MIDEVGSGDVDGGGSDGGGERSNRKKEEEENIIKIKKGEIRNEGWVWNMEAAWVLADVVVLVVVVVLIKGENSALVVLM